LTLITPTAILAKEDLFMKKEPYILAVDLGTDFGWYDGGAGGNVSMSQNGRYKEFLNFMQPMIKNRGYTHVVYERVDHNVGRSAALVYCGLRAILIACAQNAGCIVDAPYNPTQLKLMFTGSGKSDKAAMIAECVRRGFQPEGDDHADAIALHCIYKENMI
jgi:crossover junction endodeoxyribonuclease RuvC